MPDYICPSSPIIVADHPIAFLAVPDFCKKVFFNFLFLGLLQPVYSMENDDKGFFSHLFNTLHSYTLYFPFRDAVELARKNGFSPQDCEIIKDYIIKGADPNWKIGEETLLRFAIKYQKKDLFEFLLQHKADINAGNKDRITPLHGLIASSDKNNYEKFDIKIEDFVKHQANVNAMDNDGTTPLHIATLIDDTGGIKCIKSLIKYSADINQKDNRGYSPLAFALCDDRTPVEVIKELCNAGASLITSNKEKDTAFHIIAIGGDDSIKYIEPIITHARFDAYKKGSQAVPYTLWILKHWEINNSIKLPKDIKLHILSQLSPPDLYPYKKLCKELLQKNYNHILLPQVHERVENIKQILARPNNENETALQYALEKFSHNQECINNLRLLDGSKLRDDYEDFIMHFPAILNSQKEEDKSNLVRQMFENCAQLFLE